MPNMPFRRTRLLLAGMVLLTTSAVSVAEAADRINFDSGWRFALGHASEPAKDFDFSDGSFSAFGKAGTNAGPIGLGFADETWRTVDLPHDWAIELPFDKTADLMHGYKPLGRKFPQNSVGWYRKSFVVPQSDLGKRIRLQFDGIYRDAYVWINGHLLGRNESGYIGATFDLTDYIKYGVRNVISVRVDASHFEGWFYEGAGIYRHAWLIKSPSAHFVDDGVSSVPTIDGEKGTVRVRAEFQNHTDQAHSDQMRITIFDAQGHAVAQGGGEALTVKVGETGIAEGEATLDRVQRWSLENPYLYTCRVEFGPDRYEHKIGFRTFRFDPDKGFFLNEKPVRIQGTCNHQDHAGVGAAIPDGLNAWRIMQLKKFGCNFYRTAHNPPTPELLEACDRLGMLVLDEVRMFGSTGEALSQLERIVRRDRNHPSVIFWSIGNEEWGTQATDESARIAATMMRRIKKLDPTRPVTFGANNGAERGGINSVVDIRGFNYNLGGLDEYRRFRPQQPIHGSETASTVTTRGEYVSDPIKGYVAAYDTKKIDWGSTAEEWWRITLAREWFAGGFVWTGFDYRGEPTPYAWPNINSHFGILDTCGFFKDIAYYYQAWWTDKPVLHILPHWTHPGKEGKPIDVWVFSNHEEVELFLNGSSIGRKKMERGGHLEWRVNYQAGSVKAVGYRGGASVQETIVDTAGPAASLVLESEVVDGIAIVTVKAVDARGRVVPDAAPLVSFEATDAKILGVGNGDPSCHEPDTMISAPNFVEIVGWKMKRVTGEPAALAETKPDFDDSAWETANIRTNQLKQPGETAVFRTSFQVDDVALRTTLGVGPIDDLGWVYVNGELVGTTNQWDATHQFEVAGKLKKGKNVLAIVVRNNGGEGGLTRGVKLAGPEIPPKWSRSLFHGLGQVVLKVGANWALSATAPGLVPAAVVKG